MIAFLIIDEPAEANQRLLHLLVPVKPLLLARPDVRDPAVSQLLRPVVQAKVFSIGERVVIDSRLYEITGHVTFMVAAMVWRPAFRPVLAIGQSVRRLQIAIRHLR